MSDFDDRVHESIAKRDSGNFTLDDISEYPRRKAKRDTKVTVLKRGKWVRVNDYQLFINSLSGDMDDGWIYVIVRKHKPWLNWLLLPLAQLKSDDSLVVSWHTIPGTNLKLDIWYVGDGSGGVPLVFEVNND